MLCQCVWHQPLMLMSLFAGAIPDGVCALGKRTLLRVQLPEADLGLPGGALVHLLRPLPRLLHEGVPPRAQRQDRGPRTRRQRTRAYPDESRPPAHPGGRGPNPQAQDSVSVRHRLARARTPFPRAIRTPKCTNTFFPDAKIAIFVCIPATSYACLIYARLSGFYARKRYERFYVRVRF
jgi:hypothetical protein